MREQLLRLREYMKANRIDWTLVYTQDAHASEYVGDYDKARAWVSGFTGSAGTLLVGLDEAWLWTDGRYFLQATQQLSGSGIGLMKDRMPGTPTIHEYLKQHAAGQTLALDGRTATINEVRALEKTGCVLRLTGDPVGAVWTERPARSAAPVWELPLAYAGEARQSKLARIRQALTGAGADVLALSSLMDVCWLLNIRGGDVAHTPVVLSYLLLAQDSCTLFVNEASVPADVKAALNADGVQLRPYDGFYQALSDLPAGTAVLLNPDVANSAMAAALPDGVRVVEGENPTFLPKACKNSTEVANFREAHIRDGVAVTRFMYWLKHNVGKEPMDELSVAEKLESFRREQSDYIEQSFSPIMGYGPHGAIIHYGATPATNVPLAPRSFLLSDTGGHYLQGTTDITRTYALGELTDEERRCYTLVLKSHLRLGGAIFPEGASGMSIDAIARQPLWQEKMNYNHGTGHGVGYILSVHEGPQNIRWRGAKEVPLQPGMVMSDEPGLYLEGRFGVRLENLVVCVEAGENEFGRFLRFEHLTMVPWDLDAVDVSLLTDEEIALLNDYHRQVREAVRPRLTDPAEQSWLDHATRVLRTAAT